MELGPGNGCVTHALLERMTADSILLCLELNSEFAAQLNTVEDPRLHVYNACASSIRDILDQLNIKEVDHVAFYDKPFLKFERLLETYLSFAPRGFRSFKMALPIWLKEKLFQKSLLNKNLQSFDVDVDW